MKAYYQVNLSITDEEHERLKKLQAQGISNIAIFREGMEQKEKQKPRTKP